MIENDFDRIKRLHDHIGQVKIIKRHVLLWWVYFYFSGTKLGAPQPLMADWPVPGAER